MNYLNKYFKVLDDGFVVLKDYMGSDEDIEQAARISYQKGTRSISDTKNLLRFLLRSQHSSPFQQASLKFHVRLPMDVWRQFCRHRTWQFLQVNEYSTRYSEAIDSQQKTSPLKWRLQSSHNKQGSDSYVTEYPADPNEVYVGLHSPGEFLSAEEKELQEHANSVYKNRLLFGVAREQARKDLPLSTYTEVFMSVDLWNLFHFLKLRCDNHAQEEIREYANIMAGMVKAYFPLSFQAWYDYMFQGVLFTGLDRKLLYFINNDSETLRSTTHRDMKTLLKEDTELVKELTEFAYNKLGMSKRELQEFFYKIDIPEERDFDLYEEIIQKT